MDDDRTLYRRWLDRRDADAFAVLVRRHADLVHDVAFRVAGDRDAAEDALQEATIRLASDRTPRPAEVGVRAWLARAAIDRARNARRADRARARRERATGHAREEAVVEARSSVDAEAARDVEAALGRADAEDAAILALRFRHGVEYAELAAILGVSAGAVRVRVHRATEALRRDVALHRRDGPAIEQALRGLLVTAAPAASVATALDAALGAAVAPSTGAATTATAAPRTGLPTRLVAAVPGGLAAIVAVGLALAGGLVMLVRRDDPAQRAEPAADVGTIARGDARPERDAAPRPADPALAVHPPRVGDAIVGGAASGGRRAGSPPAEAAPPKPDGLPRAPSVPGKPTVGSSPVPRPTPAEDTAGTAAARPPRRLHTLRVRAEIVAPTGPPIPVAIDSVMMRGTAVPGPVVDAEGLRIESGPGIRSVVHVRTADPRALVPWMRLFVMEPVPETLVARFPSAADPRLDPVVLEIVDAASGAPVAGATLDWQWPGTRAPILVADVAGRLLVVPTVGSDGVVERGIRALATRGFLIHAPGLRAGGKPAWGAPRPVDDEGAGPEQAELEQPSVDAWLAGGTWVVRLEREREDLASMTARVLLADGRPAAGALVYVTSIAPRRLVAALGAAVTPNDVDFGFRRVGPDAAIEFGARPRTALEVFVDDCPVGVFALSRDRWPASGSRELRLAPLADVTIAIDGIPAGEPASWGFDPLGAARTPTDGANVPITWDEGFDPKTREDEFAVFTFLGQGDLAGDLRPGHNEVRFRYPVGWSRPLHVRVGDASRAVEVRAPAAGPVHLDVRWDEMSTSTDR